MKCIAIDDEPLALTQLSDYISQVPFLSLVKSCQDAFEAMKILSEEADVVEGVPIDDGISVKYRSVMGVELPKIEYEKTPLRVGYGFERANSKVDYAYICFYHVKEMTVKLAEVENSVYRLANNIRKTQKRANALQNISIPRFEATVKMITEALDEKDREEFSRQKVIKAQKNRQEAAKRKA